MTLDLRELWTRIIDGDFKAWHQLVKQYSTLVYTIACRTGLSRPDAEDCAQHTWLALYRRRRSIKDPAAVPAWLIRTTHREAVRTVRNLGRQPKTDDLTDSVDAGPLPHESIASVEFQVALKKGLDRLDPRCRKLIEEMYLSNRKIKYKELASVLGVKSNSLGPLRKRCLVKLREILKEIGYVTD